MEQMTNLSALASEDHGAGQQTSSWRSFGSIAASLVARAESQQMPDASAEEHPFLPVAWAAE